MTENATRPDGIRRPAASGEPTRRQIAVAYVLIGLAVGAAWAAGGDMPAWQHALRLLAAILIVPPLIHWIRRRLNRSNHLPLRRIVTAKVLLIAVALVLDLLLAHWTSHAGVITAAFLAVAVALGGPALHNSAPRRPANPLSPAAR